MVGTAVTPGLGARLRRVVLRLLAVGGLALLAWLLGVLLNSGTASAAQNSTVSPGTPHSTDGTDSGTGGGLLGGLLGGLGNTVGNVTGTVSGITTTVTNVTTGLVSGVTTTLGTTVQTVTGIIAPTTLVVTGVTTSITHPGGSASGSTTQTVPVAAKPVEHQTNSAIPAVTPAAPQSPAVPALAPPATPTSHKAISVAVQRIAKSMPHVLPIRLTRLPDQPAPQPAPAPTIPLSVVSAGHGFQGPIRHALGTPVTHHTAPSLTAFGVHAPDPAAQAARDQGLPPTTPD